MISFKHVQAQKVKSFSLKCKEIITVIFQNMQLMINMMKHL